MGLEMSKVGEELWTGFMREGFNLVEHYRTLQAKQPAPPRPPPAHQAAQLPPVQRQQQQPFMRPLSAPPMVSPTYCEQLNLAWQPGPCTEFQQQGLYAFGPNLSGLNTSGLSSLLDPAGQPTGPVTSSALSTPDAARSGSRGSNTSDIMKATQQTLNPDQDQE